MQLPLFTSASPALNQGINQQRVGQVSGLQLIEDFISPDYEAELVAQINKNSWDTSMKRRVQHYGYRYDYRNRRINDHDYLGVLPSWLQQLAEKVQRNSLFAKIPDQAIVNEYMPGQGITPHIDCEPCFDDRIVSISLGSRCTMLFDAVKERREIEISLSARSALLLAGESRYNWRHSIPARKRDDWPDSYYRSRRISITFRIVTK